MALLADHPFIEAAQRLRSAGSRLGDPRTLFWYDGSGGRPKPMRLRAEMIVPSAVEDDFGRDARPRSTFLEYSLVLEYVEPKAGRLGGIRLVEETLGYFRQREAAGKLDWPHNKTLFRDHIVRNERRTGEGYIDTEIDSETGEPVILVRQEGGGGRPRRASAERTSRTVVSTTTSSDDPTILAARREMQQWRQLALEPSAMRSPDSMTDSSSIASNGAHLASALYRLALNESEDVYARVAANASALTDVREVRVDADTSRDLLTLEARLGGGPFLPARALSDGTLRFLALSIIEVDPKFAGLICMEEPENGIHPARVQNMTELLRDLAVDPFEEPGEENENPLRQVIVNTHSPRVISYTAPDELVLALPSIAVIDGQPLESIKLMPMANTWRAESGIYGEFAGSRATMADFLTKPVDALMTLDWPERDFEQD